MEFYKLSFLRQKESGAEWEHIYLRTDQTTPEIMVHQDPLGMPLNSKIESITEQEMQKVLDEYHSNRDSGRN